MAALTAPPAQQQPQPQPGQPAGQDGQAALIALTVLLLAGLPPAVFAAEVARVLAPLGITTAAAQAAARLLGPHTTVPEPAAAAGTARRWVDATAAARRAAYLHAAARRDSPVPLERRYLDQHLMAERARQAAADETDRTAGQLGVPVLGWYARLDATTTQGCRAMHGRNFDVSVPPVVEGRPAFPGSVHPACRCQPGPPWPV